jgi:hypothetical protein
MNKEEIKKVWAEVKINQKKLKSCDRHLFMPKKGKYPFEYRCQNCGGEISSVNKRWYEIGLKHGEGDKK